MKKILLFLTIAVIGLSACTKNPKAINSKELQGKYELDIASLVGNELDGEDEMTKAFASFLLSQMHVTFQFQGDLLILDASESLRAVLEAFSEDDFSMPLLLDYRITNDSILTTREQGKEEWKDTGVLRKIADSYDYLEWVAKDEDSGEVTTLKLRKTE